MPKASSKTAPSKHAIDAEIEVDGFAVFASFTDTRTGETVEMKLHRRAAAALSVLLGTCDGVDEERGAMAVTLRGEMQFIHAKGPNEDERTPAISAA
jgi:hypothetical protein